MCLAGVEVGDTVTNKGVPVATSAPVQKLNHGLVEVKVDSAAARGLVLPKVEVDNEAATLKARSAHEKSVEAQIRLLENQVLNVHIANSINSHLVDLLLLMPICLAHQQPAKFLYATVYWVISVCIWDLGCTSSTSAYTLTLRRCPCVHCARWPSV